MTPHLRPGASLHLAIERLEGVALDARNLRSYHSQYPVDHVTQYLQWVEKSEVALQGAFSLAEARDLVRGEDYWRLRALAREQRAVATLHQGLEERIAVFEQSGEELRRLRRAIEEGATPALVDTHVLMHFEAPSAIKWEELMGGACRLVLPLRVVEELDKKKWEGTDRIRQRARDASSMLRKHLDGGPGPTEVRPGVTLEVLVPPEPRTRERDADQEILNLSVLFTKQRPASRLVTEDAAFELRARALGVDVLRMPAKYLRDKARVDRPSE